MDDKITYGIKIIPNELKDINETINYINILKKLKYDRLNSKKKECSMSKDDVKINLTNKFKKMKLK